MNTFDRKDVFSWSNAQQAEPYKDKNGYFTCHYSDNLKDWDYGTLGFINYDMPIGDDFYASYADSDDYMGTYGLFIPEDKVTVTPYNEDGFRAFNSVEEFESVIKPMTVFKIIHTDHSDLIHKAIYIKSFINENEIFAIVIVPIYSATDDEIKDFINNFDNIKELPKKWNVFNFNYHNLFENYRYFDNSSKYFGIKD